MIKLLQDILCFQRLTPALKGGACAACSVKNACPVRKDLLVPAEVVRDADGNIVGCKSLGR